MTHICISDLTSIGSDNGLSPGRRQAIIRTNAGILLIRPLGINFSEFLVEILISSFKKMRLKVSSAKRRPFCLGLNELSTLEGYGCNHWSSPWYQSIDLSIIPLVIVFRVRCEPGGLVPGIPHLYTDLPRGRGGDWATAGGWMPPQLTQLGKYTVGEHFWRFWYPGRIWSVSC